VPASSGSSIIGMSTHARLMRTIGSVASSGRGSIAAMSTSVS
jgi:hypothetical protein